MTVNHTLRNFEEIPLPESLGILRARRSLENRSGPAVVLLHGGNTSGETFVYPAGGLAGYLAQPENGGWNVWLVEWRGSPHVLEPILKEPKDPEEAERERREFVLDTTADNELPGVLEFIRGRLDSNQPLAVVAHCLSGCATSLAIARGRLRGLDIQAFVLTTLGLFFESGWDGWVKAEDYILERILTTHPKCRDIPPQQAREWPEPIGHAFDRWPSAWLPHTRCAADDPLRELSFMFGQPYARQALHSEMWPPLLQRLLQRLKRRKSVLAQIFGPMHLGLYLHVAQMVRRGHAARFDASLQCSKDLNFADFRGQRLTLITGAENRLWHRDSIDRMYEWLCSNTGGAPHRFQKYVLPGYGHQDLLWGKRASFDVYRLVRNAIN